MNAEMMKGKWMQIKGSVRTQWGKLTDDEVTQIAGDRDKLIGKIQEKYGIARDEAEKQVESWSSKL